MIKTSVKIIPHDSFFSALALDTLDGERVLVIARATGDKVCHFSVKDGLNTRILPLVYSTSPSLSVIMYDDDNQYNGVIVDNVQAMAINTRNFDPNNPQPFESP